MFLSVMKVLIDYMYLFAVPPKRTGKKGQEKKVICDCLKGCFKRLC